MISLEISSVTSHEFFYPTSGSNFKFSIATGMANSIIIDLHVDE